MRPEWSRLKEGCYRCRHLWNSNHFPTFRIGYRGGNWSAFRSFSAVSDICRDINFMSNARDGLKFQPAVSICYSSFEGRLLIRFYWVKKDDLWDFCVSLLHCLSQRDRIIMHHTGLVQNAIVPTWFNQHTFYCLHFCFLSFLLDFVLTQLLLHFPTQRSRCNENSSWLRVRMKKEKNKIRREWLKEKVQCYSVSLPLCTIDYD